MTKGRLERRLAVIMATDIVCSSRLMEADERRTLDAIKRLQASIFSPNIDTRGGRIAKLMEDGGLVAFNSAVNAVECAISLQEGKRDFPRTLTPAISTGRLGVGHLVRR
ncbi:hypothetical protein GOC10_30255, partial [Sinorhizobium meliloti]|nr:hypothetical protein [Sinorhizobium meliloti]MDW9998546.1 hypothetical protein [Sinorhizobium meliloti]